MVNTIEDMIQVLVSLCDGAKNKDYSGFNKADTGNGKRLAALLKADIPWTYEDMDMAISLVKKYWKQIRVFLTEKEIENSKEFHLIKFIEFEDFELKTNLSLSEKSEMSCYLTLSEDRRFLYFHVLRVTSDIEAIMKTFKVFRNTQYGQRPMSLKIIKKDSLRINKKREKTSCVVIPFNKTTFEEIKRLSNFYKIPIDPTIFSGPDKIQDFLLMNKKAVFYFSGMKNGIRQKWFVIDIHKSEKKIIKFLKDNLLEKSVLKRDSIQWFYPITEKTSDLVNKLSSKLGFSIDPKIMEIKKGD